MEDIEILEKELRNIRNLIDYYTFESLDYDKKYRMERFKTAIENILKERQADKEKIKELEEIEKIHQEENGEQRKEINEENKRCMILAVENQDLKEKRISKDKIRTRIDEIQSKINNGKTDYCVIDFEFQIKMLQELLKDGGE